MPLDKSLLAGSTTMLVLKLLDGQDMYGYQMIEELARRSDHSFALKTGTLYPLLHSLEGRALLCEKEEEWTEFTAAVDRVLKGGGCLGPA